MISLFGKTPSTLGVVHFVGIGGVGMSALAEFLHECGYRIQGSDISENAHVKRLKQKGVKVFIGHARANVNQAFRIVYSSAIRKTNPEIMAAEELGVRQMHRSELLAEICRHFKSIAVSGTHGKTTTTALCYTLLAEGNKQAGVINGGVLYSIKSNMKLPEAEGCPLVAEADESDGSFTSLKPDYALVTNIEAEHMDYYASLDNVLRDYAMFASNASKAVVVNIDDANARNLSTKLKGKRVITTGMHEEAHVRASNLRKKGAAMMFDLQVVDTHIENVTVYMPGEHNVKNALMAIAVAADQGVSLEDIKKGLASFRGVSRRFIKLGEVNNAVVIDDYAHHPSEVLATIKSAKEGFSGRVVAVFQPHRYTRLRDHMEGFVDSFELADEVVVLPVYEAGEAPIVNVDSDHLVVQIKKKFKRKAVSLAKSPDEMSHMVMDGAEKGDVVLCMGAGNVNQWAAHLVKKGKK